MSYRQCFKNGTPRAMVNVVFEERSDKWDEKVMQRKETLQDILSKELEVEINCVPNTIVC